MNTKDYAKRLRAAADALDELNGHALHRARDAGGTETYLAERWRLVRHLPTLDDARRFLAQRAGPQA